MRILNKERDNGLPYKESDNLSHILDDLCNKYNLKLIDGRNFGVGRISEAILNAIKEADVVFVDANQANENIWYEFGYAHSINFKKVVYLFRHGKPIPFDVGDYRGFEYDNLEPQSTKELSKRIDAALGELLIQSQTNRILHSNSHNWEDELSNYVSGKEIVKKEICEFLKNTCLNIKEFPEIRKRAVQFLIALEYIDLDLLFRMINPNVDEGIRVAFLQRLQNINAKLPLDFWQIPLSSKIPSILREASAAVTIHWLKGNVADDYFFDYIVKHKEWIVRKHLVIRICENMQPKVLNIIDILLTDQRDEIYKRFIDWIDGLIISKKVLTKTECTVIARIKNAWQNSEELILQTKLEEIDSLLVNCRD